MATTWNLKGRSLKGKYYVFNFLDSDNAVEMQRDPDAENLSRWQKEHGCQQIK